MATVTERTYKAGRLVAERTIEVADPEPSADERLTGLEARLDRAANATPAGGAAAIRDALRTPT